MAGPLSYGWWACSIAFIVRRRCRHVNRVTSQVETRWCEGVTCGARAVSAPISAHSDGERQGGKQRREAVLLSTRSKSSKGAERSGESRRCPSESLSLRWHGCRGAGGPGAHGQPWSQSARQKRCEPRIRDRAATCPEVSQASICCGGEEPREQRATHHRLAPVCGEAEAMKPGDRWRVAAGRGRPRARAAA